MAIIEQKVPSPGESITEVTISRFLVKNGEYVEKEQALAEIDSDKATLTLNAEDNGAVTILAKDGDVVKVGQVIVKIDTAVKGEPKKKEEPKKETAKIPAVVTEASTK